MQLNEFFHKSEHAFATLALCLVAFSAAASSDSDENNSTIYQPYFYTQKYTPPHISPEWKSFYEAYQPHWDVPAPDDIEGWKELALQKETTFIEYFKHYPEKYGVKLVEELFDGVRVVKIIPADHRNPGKAMVYLHGGAWSSFSPESTWVDTIPLAAKLGIAVYAVDYTKAPEASLYDIINESITVFEHLVKNEGYKIGNLGIHGCSAGGHLSLAVPNEMRNRGIGLPGVAVARSPMVDFTLTNDTWITLERDDPMISTEAYVRKILPILGISDYRDPVISPHLDTDLGQGMPPTLIQTGGKEVLLSDSLVMFQVLEAAGQTAKLDVYDGMPHCFPMILPETAEAKAADAKQEAWIRQYLDLEELP
jgi:acetyl esterase/lipase